MPIVTIICEPGKNGKIFKVVSNRCRLIASLVMTIMKQVRLFRDFDL